MATWLKNSPCPACGSHDNLGVYSDGSSWCWGCRKYTPPHNNIENLKTRLLQSKRKSNEVVLPDDITFDLPDVARNWIGKYKLSLSDLTKLQMMFSPHRELLIFPFRDEEGGLQAWIGRYFGEREKHPKYLTYGTKDFINLYPNKESSTVSVCEDVISAVKVSNYTNAMSLLGAHLNMTTALRLSKMYDKLVLWLDGNKYKDSLNFQQAYAPLYSEVKVIYTPNDPKDYSYEEISKHF